jgi:RNA-splicing ligase RtcB
MTTVSSEKAVHVIGKHSTAVCYAGELETVAMEQIRAVCDREEFADCKIRIMPDVHAGMGCVIGTTMTITDKIVPGMVGVDIGCGMETVRLAENEIDYKALDNLIRREIPSGRDIRKKYHPLSDAIDLAELRCFNDVHFERAKRSIGTLGGGNHFIEVDHSGNGELYLVIHSGSRHIGKEVATLYQEEAYKTLCGNSKRQIAETIIALKAAGREREIAGAIKRLKGTVKREVDSIPKDLAYVADSLFDDYIHDMKIIQRFAVLNRQAMSEVILRGMGLTEIDRFTTIHNYIDTDSMILRKGSVSAKKGEYLLLPINMRDGSLICVGKGNEEWNYSAPHGAGRLMSRQAAFRTLSMEEYIAGMNGIFTTSVSRKTLDESPMAYKNIDDILGHIGPTADVIERLRPVYNFKASE